MRKQQKGHPQLYSATRTFSPQLESFDPFGSMVQLSERSVQLEFQSVRLGE